MVQRIARSKRRKYNLQFLLKEQQAIKDACPAECAKIDCVLVTTSDQPGRVDRTRPRK